jgi:hypothetical protein
MINIQNENKNLILKCAFRYALGRKTYIVKTVVDELLANWDNFEIWDKKQLKDEIVDYEERVGNLGDDIDTIQWYRVIARYRAECKILNDEIAEALAKCDQADDDILKKPEVEYEWVDATDEDDDIER